MKLGKAVKFAIVAAGIYSATLFFGYTSMYSLLEDHKAKHGIEYTLSMAELWKELYYEKHPNLKPLNFTQKWAVDDYIKNHLLELIDKKEV